jgi:hypothetical protein
MAFFRGMDGSVSLGTTPDFVAQITAWNFQAEFEILETTVVGDPARTRRTGLVDGSGSFTMRFDYGDTLGQKLLFDKYTAAKPDGAVQNLQLWLDNDPKHIDIPNAVLTTFPITSALGNIVEATVSFQTNGPWAITWS